MRDERMVKAVHRQSVTHDGDKGTTDTESDEQTRSSTSPDLNQADMGGSATGSRRKQSRRYRPGFAFA